MANFLSNIKIIREISLPFDKGVKPTDKPKTELMYSDALARGFVSSEGITNSKNPDSYLPKPESGMIFYVWYRLSGWHILFQENIPSELSKLDEAELREVILSKLGDEYKVLSRDVHYSLIINHPHKHLPGWISKPQNSPKPKAL